jgi:hypothetical protein
MLTSTRVTGRNIGGNGVGVFNGDTIEALYNADPERVRLRGTSTVLRKGKPSATERSRRRQR